MLDENFFTRHILQTQKADGDGSGGGKMKFDQLSEILALISQKSDVVSFSIAKYLPFDAYKIYQMFNRVKIFTEGMANLYFFDFKIYLSFNRMQCEALEYATSNVVGGALLGLRLVTEADRGLLRGKELLCFASSQLQAERNLSLFPINKERKL